MCCFFLPSFAVVSCTGKKKRCKPIFFSSWKKKLVKRNETRIWEVGDLYKCDPAFFFSCLFFFPAFFFPAFFSHLNSNSFLHPVSQAGQEHCKRFRAIFQLLRQRKCKWVFTKLFFISYLLELPGNEGILLKELLSKCELKLVCGFRVCFSI